MEFLLKAKFPKYSKNSFSSNSARKQNKENKRKICFNLKRNTKKERMTEHLPSVSVFPEGLILFKSQTNVQLWPSIIHLSSASYINRNEKYFTLYFNDIPYFRNL